MHLYNEAAFITDLAKGEEKAFRQLFEMYFDKVYKVAFMFTKSTVVAEEIAQDVFLKIWLGREKLISVRKLDSYVFIVARNHIFNVLRKKINEEPFTDQLVKYFEETAASAEQHISLKEVQSLVKKAVEQLPPQQKLIYNLSRERGLNQEEIAYTLHLSKNTVKSHMNKALHFIRRYLRVNAEISIVLICIALSLPAIPSLC